MDEVVAGLIMVCFIVEQTTRFLIGCRHLRDEIRRFEEREDNRSQDEVQEQDL